MALTNDYMLQLELDCHSLESITLQDIPAGQREWLARVIAALRHEMDKNRNFDRRGISNDPEFIQKLQNVTACAAMIMHAWLIFEEGGGKALINIDKWMIHCLAPAIAELKVSLSEAHEQIDQQHHPL